MINKDIFAADDPDLILSGALFSSIHCPLSLLLTLMACFSDAVEPYSQNQCLE